MSEVPSSEPTALRAGDSWSWRRDDVSDYPAPAWVLSYAYRSPRAFFDLVAIPTDPPLDPDAPVVPVDPDNPIDTATSHLIDVSPIVSATFPPGDYDWYLFATSADPLVPARYQIGVGKCTVLPNVALAAAHDSRSWARRMLEAVESALLGRATTDQIDLLETQLGDKSITRDRSALLELRAKLLIEVRREDGSTIGRVNRIVARFVR